MTSNEINASETHPLANIDRIIHAPARLMIVTYLYTVESADYIILMNLTGLTWGNLSSHMSKLEEAGYITIEKQFIGKKPYTFASLTPQGRAAFRAYKQQMQQVLASLPD